MDNIKNFIEDVDVKQVERFVQDNAIKLVDNKIYNWLGDHGFFGPKSFSDKCVAKLESFGTKVLGSKEQRLFTKEAQSRAANVLVWGVAAWIGSGQMLRFLSAVSKVGILAFAIPAGGALAANALFNKS